MNMTNFVKTKLGDILKLEYGKSLVAQKRVNGGFLVYGSSGVVGAHNEYLVDGPAIIIGRKGSVGEVHYCKINFYPIDTTYFIKNDPKKYDIKYLYYFLKNLDLKHLHSDVGVPGLNRDTVHDKTVLFPVNISDQIRISSILSIYDDLIECNDRRIKVLEEIAQRLYTEWFVDFRFPGHEKVHMFDSGAEHGMIPEGWEVKNLGQVADLNYGKALIANERCLGNIPVYGSSGVVGMHNSSLVSGPGVIVGRKGNIGTVYWENKDLCD